MDWWRLQNMGAVVRPLTRPEPLGHRRAQFSAPFSRTVMLLGKELAHLGATRIVLELDLQERDIRLDGFPRANARPDTPAVAVAFESRYGPLRYSSGVFTDWTDNLRGIALGLEALRAVDRYGVTKRGEQYAGWKALPQSTDPADRMLTEEDAYEVLDRVLGPGGNRGGIDARIREAQRKTHPDVGGDPDDFRAVMKAKEILGV